MFIGVWLGGILLLTVRLLVRRIKIRKYRRPSVEMEYLLPDAKNEYLRHRLQTSLAVSEECSSPDAEFLHVQKLLYALGEKKLTAADSLIVRKLKKEVGMYASKEYFTQNDKGELATVFSRVLTLCAKYEI